MIDQEDKIAYLREMDSTNQCQLNFLLHIENSDFGVIHEEINAVRQKTDTVGSLVQHIHNKIQKLIQDKLQTKTEFNMDMKLSLRRKSKRVHNEVILKSFVNQVNDNVTFHIFDDTFRITVNAPLVREMTLPLVLYANCSVQPSKFKGMFTDTKKSTFLWYKSLDKKNWLKLSKGYTYTIKEDDVGHFLKLVCYPSSLYNVMGPSSEVTSENKVELMGALPRCPFEDRHELTRDKLTGDKFRVVSYNILSDRYTDSDQFPYCPPQFLSIDYRKQVIMKELVGYNADIICLQEVDNRHYNTYFKEEFKQLGYATTYHRKGNRIPEGLSCMYNKARFKQISSQQLVLSTAIKERKMFNYLWNLVKRDSDLMAYFLRQATSLQITVLREKRSNNIIIVGNTHLFYHPDANHIRLIQMNMATTYLEVVKKRFIKEGENVSIIFCGDFNSSPKSSIVSYMTEGRINPEHEDVLKISGNGKAILYHSSYFTSACGTPKYTNYTREFKGCLDYIFVDSNKLEVVRDISITDEKELSKHEGLPNKYFPSDHLALVADLKFASMTD